jgi:hypothetical protein
MINTKARQTAARFAVVSYPVVWSKAAETLASKDRFIVRQGLEQSRGWRLNRGPHWSTDQKGAAINMTIALGFHQLPLMGVGTSLLTSILPIKAAMDNKHWFERDLLLGPSECNP